MESLTMASLSSLSRLILTTHKAKLLNLAYPLLKHPHHNALLNLHRLASHVTWIAVHAPLA